MTRQERTLSRLSDAEVFASVVRAGGFSAAARELGLTQPAVSRRVAALEARLGVRLVARSSRGIRLTDAGRLFHDAAERALGELDAAEAAVSATAREPGGTLRLHLPPAFGRRWIMPHVARFALQHPGLALSVTLADRVVDLATERADVAVRIGPLRGAGLVARRLGDARLLLCGAPGYLARRGRPRSPEELADHDCLVLGIYAAQDRWRFAGRRRRHEVKVRARLVTNDVEALVAAARAGMGLAVLPEFLVADELASGGLEAVLARHRLPSSPIHVVFPERRHVSGAARAFADFLVAEVGARRVP